MRSRVWKQKRPLLKRWAWVTLLAFLASGTVAAQDSSGLNQVDWSKKAAALSTQQKSSGMKQLRKRALQVNTSLLNKITQARKDQDLVALGCLNPKHDRVQALLLLIEKENLAFNNALLKKDNDALNTAYANTAQYEASIRDLEVQARACWGKKGIYTGKTDIRVTKPPSISTTDPTIPVFKEPVVYRPSNASGFY